MVDFQKIKDAQIFIGAKNVKMEEACGQYILNWNIETIG
jgi:hypothetical protein